MKVREALVRIIGGVNDRVLRLGRGLGCIALALTVIAILLQVYYRYVLNNALPWPEEAARALMIWMKPSSACKLIQRRGHRFCIPQGCPLSNKSGDLSKQQISP